MDDFKEPITVLKYEKADQTPYFTVIIVSSTIYLTYLLYLVAKYMF